MPSSTVVTPEALKNLIIAYLPWVIATLTAVVVITAGVIQTLNTLIMERVKAHADYLRTQLELRQAELDTCKEDLAKERARPIMDAPNKSPATPPAVGYTLGAMKRRILTAAVIGLCLAALSVPFSDRFRANLNEYRHKNTEAIQLSSDLSKMAAPFTAQQVLHILDTQPQTSKKSMELDGQVFDLDHSSNKKFTYSGTQPALLVGTSIKALQITSPNGSRFELLIKPYASQE